MTRMNITLPNEIAKKLAAKRNKSRFIAEVLQEKFDLESRIQLDALLIEGYKADAAEDKALNKEWDEISVDTWE